MGQQRELQLVEGWLTDDPTQFELYTRRLRSWGVVDQLAVDARRWKPWMFWGGTAGCLGFAVVKGSVALAASGAFLSFSYLVMLYLVLSGCRRQQLIEVTVHHFGHRFAARSDLVWGVFEHPQTRAAGRALCDDWAVQRVTRLDGSVRALVAFDASAEYCPVVGLAPPDSHQVAAGQVRPDTPLEARCLRHAANTAVGTCARCGSFICSECERVRFEARYCASCSLQLRPPAGPMLFVASAVCLCAAVLEVASKLTEGTLSDRLDGVWLVAYLTLVVLLFVDGKRKRTRGFGFTSRLQRILWGATTGFIFLKLAWYPAAAALRLLLRHLW